MDYYLFSAHSVTQAQRMAHMLGQAGIYGSVQRLPAGLSPQGCAYGVRIGSKDYERSLALTQSVGLGPIKVFHYDKGDYTEVVR